MLRFNQSPLILCIWWKGSPSLNSHQHNNSMTKSCVYLLLFLFSKFLVTVLCAFFGRYDERALMMRKPKDNKQKMELHSFFVRSSYPVPKSVYTFHCRRRSTGIIANRARNYKNNGRRVVDKSIILYTTSLELRSEKPFPWWTTCKSQTASHNQTYHSPHPSLTICRLQQSTNTCHHSDEKTPH